jgi:hypothetical protein
MKKLSGILALVIMIMGLVAARGSEIKLGILCTDSSGASLADLLTVELAHLEGIAVLERTELDRIIREQSLNRSLSADFLKAGALAGADGLVILEPRQLSKGVSLNLRVVGIRYGVALGWWEYTVPSGEVSTWSKGAALQIKNLLPKLTSSEQRAVPISFVGFTSPASSPDTMLLEREINNLFLKRLGAEPDLLVLERQKLLESAFEKVLSGDDRKFWNGAFLLDGMINPEGISEGAVTVRFRLVGPEGKMAGESKISGSRTNLANLSAEFVQQVRQLLNSGSSTVTWDSAAEAKRFYDEAELAVRWGFWPEARADADAALALGKNDRDIRILRLMAYAGLLADQIASKWQQCRPDYGVIVSYETPPSPESLPIALDAAHQIRDALHSPVSVSDTQKLEQAVENAMGAIGLVTLKYYIGSELRRGHEDELSDLRAIMREVTDELLGNAETNQIRIFDSNTSQQNALQSIETYGILGSGESGRPWGQLDVPMLLAKYGPLWQETPEGCVCLDRRLKVRLGFKILDVELRKPANESEWTPVLCGWKWADRRRIDEVSARAAKENRLLDEARSNLLSIAFPKRDLGIKGISGNCQAASEFFLANRDQLTTLSCRTAFASALDECWQRNDDYLPDGIREELLTNTISPLRELLKTIDQATASQKFPAVQDYSSDPKPPAEKISEKTPDLSARENKYPVTNLSARTCVLPHLITRENPKPPPERQTVPLTNISDLTTAEGMRPTGKEEKIEAEALKIGAYAIPDPRRQNRVVWAEGKIWSDSVLTRQVNYDIGEFGGGLRIVYDTYLAAFDPRSGLSEKIQIPGKYFSLAEEGKGLPEYAVFPNRFAFFFPDQVVIYDRRTKEFSTIPAPLTSPHVLQLDERLLLYNAETILETTSELKDFKVLASVRRRPALNELDTLTTLAPPGFPVRLCPIGTNHLLVVANGRACTWDGNQWHSVLTNNSANFSLNPGRGESVFIDQRAGESLVYVDFLADNINKISRAYYFGPGAEQGEIWWSGMVVPNPGDPRGGLLSLWQVIPEPSEPGSKYVNLPASVPFFWLSGRGFDGTRMACFPFKERLFTASFPPNNRSGMNLHFWSQDGRNPVNFSVSLPGRNVYGGFVPDLHLFIAGENIFVWSPLISDVWRIDGAQLLSRLESALATGNPSHDAVHVAP